MKVYVQTRMKGKKNSDNGRSKQLSSFFFLSHFFCEIFSLLVVFI